MIILDVGAHIGTFIDATLETVGADIHLFEPNPVNYGYLIHKFRENDKVFFNNVALSDYNGTATLFRAYNDTCQLQQSSGRCTLYQDNKNVDNNQLHYQVNVVKLSDYWKEYINAKVDILKLDVEGAEYNILEDLLDAHLINEFKHIIIEHHHLMIPSLYQKAKVVMHRFFQQYNGLVNYGVINVPTPFSDPFLER